ncbi:MAG: AAA family ATPase, partial [Desulfobacterales bacterium]|nr:AAA family ATPase [Desulfobacterales bacterium]
KKDLQNIKKLRKEHKLVLKPPTVPETDKVFRFENVKLKIKSSNDPVDYVSLSDGEHQFIQIFGSLMMIDDDGILFLMDEPESHFNPKWRSLFMTVLNELKKKKEQCIFVTSHSPFILSDFHSETVYIFKLTNKGIKIEQPQEETYGASFDRLLKIAFDISPPLADKSLKEIRTLQKSNNKDQIAKKMPMFGDSIEKFYLYQRIEELSEQEKK